MTIMDKDEPTNEKTKKRKKKKKKRSKQHFVLYKLLSFFLIIITIITLGVLIYNEIFPIIYMLGITLISLLTMFIITFILNKNKLKAWIKNIFALLAIVITIFELLLLIFGTKTLKFLANITDTGYRVETYGIYVLKNSEYQDIKDLNNKQITYLSSNDDKEALEVISKIKKNIDANFTHQDSMHNLLNELKVNNTDALLLETSYEDIIKDEFADIYAELKLLTTYDIVSFVNVIKSDVDITKNPFIVYISGIDTSGNVASKARSDVNVLLAVNPKTKNILMINTPRDYYVTLPSKNSKDKLTHAGIYGIEQSVATLEKLYDTEIDYYARINFTSFIKIVDELGGIKVDVPKNFCEQDSNRSFKSGDLICLNKGVQTLNGEQALALSRHRKTIGDRARGKNQMLVLEAIINKAISPKIITKYSSILKALNGRVVTNMTTDEMIKFIKMQMKGEFNWTFNNISANGANALLPCYSLGNLKASVIEPEQDTIEAVKLALHNLYNDEENVLKGIEELSMTKTTRN